MQSWHFENQIFSRRLTWVNLKKTRYISIFPNGPFWHNEGGGAWLLIRVIPCRVAELFYSNQYQNCAICHDENMQAVASILEQSESNYVRFIFCYNLYNVHGTVHIVGPVKPKKSCSDFVLYWTRWSLYHTEWKSKIIAKSLCTVWQYNSAYAAWVKR